MQHKNHLYATLLQHSEINALFPSLPYSLSYTITSKQNQNHRLVTPITDRGSFSFSIHHSSFSFPFRVILWLHRWRQPTKKSIIANLFLVCISWIFCFHPSSCFCCFSSRTVAVCCNRRFFFFLNIGVDPAVLTALICAG